MTCLTCGAEFDDGLRRCPHCGNDTRPAAPWAGASPRAGRTGDEPLRPYGASSQPASAPWPRQPSGAYPPIGPDDRAAGPPPAAAALVVDVALCGLLLAGGVLAAGVVAGERSTATLADVVTRLSWTHLALGVAVVIAYWIGGTITTGRSAGRHLLEAFSGRRPAGSLARVLWPALLTVMLAGIVGGITIPAAAATGPAGPDGVAGAPELPAVAADPGSQPSTSDTYDPARTQAEQLDQLLGGSSASKADLGLALGSVCADPAGSLQTIRGVQRQREGQLARAEQLDLGALPQGERLRGTLIEALTQSVDADRSFVAYAQHVAAYGCGTDDNYRNGQRSSEAAQVAKKAFLALWNPVAHQYGLPPRTSDAI